MAEQTATPEISRRRVTMNDILKTSYTVEGKAAGTKYKIQPDESWDAINKFDKASRIKTSSGEVPLSDFLLKNVKSMMQMAFDSGFITEADLNAKVPFVDEKGEIHQTMDSALNKMVDVTEKPYAFLKLKGDKIQFPPQMNAQQIKKLMLLIYTKTVNNVDRNPKSRVQPNVLLEEIHKKFPQFKEAGAVSKSANLVVDSQSPQTVGRALNIALRKSVENAIAERTYSTTKVYERKGETPEERVLRRLEVGANVADSDEGTTIKKEIEGKMSVFKDEKVVTEEKPKGERATQKLEQTVQYDLFMAQAFDVLVPPEARLEMEKQEIAIASEGEYTKRASMRADLAKTRSIWRMAMLQYLNVSKLISGTEISVYVNDLNNNRLFSPAERDQVHAYTKEIGKRKALLDRKTKGGFNNINIESANRLKAEELLNQLKNEPKQIKEGLANILDNSGEIAKIVDPDKAKETALRMKLRNKMISDSGILTGLSVDKKALAEKIINDALDTKISIDRRLKNLPLGEDVNVAYEQLDFANGLNMVVKGLDLMHERGLSQEIPAAERYYGEGIIRDRDDKPHFGGGSDFGRDLPEERGGSGKVSMDQETTAESTVTPPTPPEPDKKPPTPPKDAENQKYEFFNGLGKREQVMVAYMIELSHGASLIDTLLPNIPKNANLREAFYKNMQKDYQELLAESIKIGLVTREERGDNVILKINGRQITSKGIPIEIPKDAIDKLGQTVVGQYGVSEMAIDSPIPDVPADVPEEYINLNTGRIREFFDKDFDQIEGPEELKQRTGQYVLNIEKFKATRDGVFYGKEGPDALKLEGEELQKSQVDYLKGAYLLYEVSELSQALGLSEDIWTARQLVEAASKDENFNVYVGRKPPVFEIRELRLDSVEKLNTVSGISFFMPELKVKINVLRFDSKEGLNRNNYSPLEKFDIRQLDLDGQEGVDNSVRLTNGELGFVIVRGGNFTLDMKEMKEIPGSIQVSYLHDRDDPLIPSPASLKLVVDKDDLDILATLRPDVTGTTFYLHKNGSLNVQLDDGTSIAEIKNPEDNAYLLVKTADGKYELKPTEGEEGEGEKEETPPPKEEGPTTSTPTQEGRRLDESIIDYLRRTTNILQREERRGAAQASVSQPKPAEETPAAIPVPPPRATEEVIPVPPPPEKEKQPGRVKQALGNLLFRLRKKTDESTHLIETTAEQKLKPPEEKKLAKVQTDMPEPSLSEATDDGKDLSTFLRKRRKSPDSKEIDGADKEGDGPPAKSNLRNSKYSGLDTDEELT